VDAAGSCDGSSASIVDEAARFVGLADEAGRFVYDPA